MSAGEYITFLVGYLLTVAGDDQPRTIYHSRIDGLLMPFSELPARGNYWGWM